MKILGINICFHKWEFTRDGQFTIFIHKVRGKEFKCSKCEKVKIEIQ